MVHIYKHIDGWEIYSRQIVVPTAPDLNLKKDVSIYVPPNIGKHRESVTK